MNEVKVYDLNEIGRSNKLSSNEFSVSNKNSPSIVFNVDFSSKLTGLQKEHLNFASNELTGDVFLVLSANKGKELRQMNPSSKNLTVQSKSIVLLLTKLMNINLPKGEKVILKISDNLSNDQNSLVFKVEK